MVRLVEDHGASVYVVLVDGEPPVDDQLVLCGIKASLRLKSFY